MTIRGTGQRQHRLLRLVHRVLQRQPGADQRHEHAGEDAVGVAVAIAQAVQRGLAGRGGEHEEGALRRVDADKPTLKPGAPPAGGGDERVVAAGVDDRDLEGRAAAIHAVEHAGGTVADRDRTARQPFLAAAGGDVGAEHVVLQAVAPAVAGIDERRSVAGLDGVDEVGDRVIHLLARRVGAQRDGKTLLLKDAGIAAGIRYRLLQHFEIGVGVVADHQRQPARLRLGDRQQQQAQHKKRPQHAHETLRSSQSPFEPSTVSAEPGRGPRRERRQALCWRRPERAVVDFDLENPEFSAQVLGRIRRPRHRRFRHRLLVALLSATLSVRHDEGRPELHSQPQQFFARCHLRAIIAAAEASKLMFGKKPQAVRA